MLSGRYPVCFVVVVPSCIAGLPAVLLWTLTSFSFGSSYMKQRHSYGWPSSLSSILPLAVLKSRLLCRVRISSRVYFIILEKVMTTSTHPRFRTFSSFLLLSLWWFLSDDENDERLFHWAPTHACTQICSEPSPHQRTSLGYHAVAPRGPRTPARLLFSLFLFRERGFAIPRAAVRPRQWEAHSDDRWSAPLTRSHLSLRHPSSICRRTLWHHLLRTHPFSMAEAKRGMGWAVKVRSLRLSQSRSY